jgi:hypothetical protein
MMHDAMILHEPVLLHASANDAAGRARLLIEAMLAHMQRALQQPSLMEDPSWALIFGTKDNMVVNLLKLVQALHRLPSAGDTPDSLSMDLPLSEEEARIAEGWLSDYPQA